MKKKPNNPNKNYQLAMEISSNFNQYSSGYAHINIRFVKVEYGKIDYFYSTSYDDKFDFHNLSVMCQMDDHHDTPYAHRIQYKDCDVDLCTAERMVKTLKTVQKGLDLHDKKFGYADTFTDYVIRIANVLNITNFVFRKDGAEDRHEPDVKYARYAINNLVSDSMAQLQPELKKAA